MSLFKRWLSPRIIAFYIKSIFTHKTSKRITLEQNIVYLQAQIDRTDLKLSQMSSDAYDRGACCAGCFFGSRFSNLCNKQDRRRDMLKALNKRLEIRNNKHDSI